MGFVSLSDEQAGSETRSGFHNWVAGLPIHTTVGVRHDQWYAVATDFCLSGMGPTREAACHDLSGALEAYLRYVYDHGGTLESAFRPLDTLTRLRVLLPLKHKQRLLLSPTIH